MLYPKLWFSNRIFFVELEKLNNKLFGIENRRISEETKTTIETIKLRVIVKLLVECPNPYRTNARRTRMQSANATCICAT